MNRVILSGRLSRDPEIRTAGDMTIAKFSLAVDRRIKKGEERKADFINVTCFGNQATFVEKYYHKGDGMNLIGRIQTGSYKNKDGATIYTTDVVADEIEFPLSNKSQGGVLNKTTNTTPQIDDSEGFTSADDLELPFS